MQLLNLDIVYSVDLQVKCVYTVPLHFWWIHIAGQTILFHLILFVDIWGFSLWSHRQWVAAPWPVSLSTTWEVTPADLFIPSGIVTASKNSCWKLRFICSVDQLVVVMVGGGADTVVHTSGQKCVLFWAGLRGYKRAVVNIHPSITTRFNFFASSGDIYESGNVKSSTFTLWRRR